MLYCKNAFPVGELFQRHFLNGTALPTVAKTGVMHDTFVPDVNAVMRVKSPISDQMGAGRKWRVHLRSCSIAAAFESLYWRDVSAV